MSLFEAFLNSFLNPKKTKRDAICEILKDEPHTPYRQIAKILNISYNSLCVTVRVLKDQGRLDKNMRYGDVPKGVKPVRGKTSQKEGNTRRYRRLAKGKTI